MSLTVRQMVPFCLCVSSDRTKLSNGACRGVGPHGLVYVICLPGEKGCVFSFRCTPGGFAIPARNKGKVCTSDLWQRLTVGITLLFWQHYRGFPIYSSSSFLNSSRIHSSVGFNNQFNSQIPKTPQKNLGISQIFPLSFFLVVGSSESSNRQGGLPHKHLFSQLKFKSSVVFHFNSNFFLPLCLALNFFTEDSCPVMCECIGLVCYLQLTQGKFYLTSYFQKGSLTCNSTVLKVQQSAQKVFENYFEILISKSHIYFHQISHFIFMHSLQGYFCHRTCQSSNLDKNTCTTSTIKFVGFLFLLYNSGYIITSENFLRPLGHSFRGYVYHTIGKVEGFSQILCGKKNQLSR
ncbi:hypothetical protein VP01_3180g2 [Puccinia sorghi]|uniref:Uncharacterized protein n=1 Tax=Puccinia sorghi TaxID=27349 RepID=A0A0L6UYK2_9BASI|nr:hypothetical protein VP01_3180g2 [Puccinia sorghi]